MKRDYQTRLKAAMELLAHEKRLLNDFQPINQLPTEVLLRIFSCYLDAMKGSSADYSINPFCNIHLTHVCSHWKAVVIECPLFWNEVDIEWPSWRFEHISRSKDAPLRVFFSDIWGNIPEKKELIRSMLSQYASRIETAVFRIYASSVGRLSEMSLMRMSRLKNFQLSLRIGDKAQIPDFIYDLPYTLNSIRIQGSWIITNPSSLFRPNLHTLNLQCHPRSTKLTMKQCLSALAQMHYLRNLSLVNVWNKHSALGTLPQVTLPRLDALRIEKHSSILCSFFLEHIETTSLTSIAIFGNGCQSVSDFDRLSRSLSAIIKTNIFLPAANRLRVDYLHPRNSLSISAWQPSDSFIPFLEFRTTYTTEFEDAPTGDDLLSSLDLSRVEEYIVDFVEDSPPLPAFISYLPTITTLSLNWRTLAMVPQLLTPVQGLDKTVPPAQPFPGLRTLRFNGYKLDHNSASAYHIEELEHVLKNITTTLQTRTPRNVLHEPFQICCSRGNPYFMRLLDAVGEGIIAMWNRVLTERTAEGTPWELWYEYTVGYQPVEEKLKGRIMDVEQDVWPFVETEVDYDVMLELWVEYT